MVYVVSESKLFYRNVFLWLMYVCFVISLGCGVSILPGCLVLTHIYMVRAVCRDSSIRDDANDWRCCFSQGICDDSMGQILPSESRPGRGARETLASARAF